jgi:hypothetical protein
MTLSVASYFTTLFSVSMSSDKSFPFKDSTSLSAFISLSGDDIFALINTDEATILDPFSGCSS